MLVASRPEDFCLSARQDTLLSLILLTLDRGKALREKDYEDNGRTTRRESEGGPIDKGRTKHG